MSHEKLFCILPPSGVPAGWDDADPRPRKMTQEMRINQIFDTPPTSDMVLQTNKTGHLPNLYNAHAMLGGYADTKHLFQFNEMTLEVDVMGQIPGAPLGGEYPRELARIMQRFDGYDEADGAIA